MRRPLLACLLTLFAFTVSSCSSGDKSETAGETATAEKAASAEDEAPGAGVAPVLARPDLLVGGWLRRSAEFYREGFSIEPDGKLRLVGNFARVGVDWSLDGDVIILRTQVPQAAEPTVERLHVRRLTDDRLELEGDYGAAGAYTRAQLARVTGTVGATDKAQLAANEGMWIRLMAPLQKGAPANSLVAFDHVVGPAELPAAFEIIYDPEAVPAGEPGQIEADIVRASRAVYRAQRKAIEAGGDVEGVTVTAAPVPTP
jgi:hypothetical protein